MASLLNANISKVGKLSRDIRISIVGAGLSGPTAALLLKHKGFNNIKLYEQLNGKYMASNGDGLSLKFPSVNGSGLCSAFETLESLKILDDAEKLGRYFVHQITYLPTGKKASKQIALDDDQGTRMDIDKYIYRWYILSVLNTRYGLKPIYEKKCTGLKPDVNGNKCTLEFADGTSDDADLVIAADGARSIIRAVTIGDNPTPLPFARIAGRMAINKDPLWKEFPLEERNIVRIMGGHYSIEITQPTSSEVEWNLTFRADKIQLHKNFPNDEIVITTDRTPSVNMESWGTARTVIETKNRSDSQAREAEITQVKDEIIKFFNVEFNSSNPLLNSIKELITKTQPHSIYTHKYYIQDPLSSQTVGRIWFAGRSFGCPGPYLSWSADRPFLNAEAFADALASSDTIEEAFTAYNELRGFNSTIELVASVRYSMWHLSKPKWSRWREGLDNFNRHLRFKNIQLSLPFDWVLISALALGSSSYIGAFYFGIF